MTKFIETTKGLINAGNIESLLWLPEPRDVGGLRKCTHVVRYRDAGAVEHAYAREDDIEALTSETIPAAPGYRLIAFSREDGTTFSPEDIVAWRISRYLAAHMPITCDGLADSGEYGILGPGGTVTVPFVCRYDSLADFKSSVAAERAASSAARAKGDPDVRRLKYQSGISGAA